MYWWEITGYFDDSIFFQYYDKKRLCSMSIRLGKEVVQGDMVTKSGGCQNWCWKSFSNLNINYMKNHEKNLNKKLIVPSRSCYNDLLRATTTRNPSDNLSLNTATTKSTETSKSFFHRQRSILDMFYWALITT